MVVENRNSLYEIRDIKKMRSFLYDIVRKMNFSIKEDDFFYEFLIIEAGIKFRYLGNRHFVKEIAKSLLDKIIALNSPSPDFYMVNPPRKEWKLGVVQITSYSTSSRKTLPLSFYEEDTLVENSMEIKSKQIEQSDETKSRLNLLKTAS